MELLRYPPRGKPFFADFREAAGNAAEAAALLLDICTTREHVGTKVERMRSLEHRGDESTRRILASLASTFQTPIDREHIQGMAQAVDDFTDQIDEAAQRMWLYWITEPTDEALELVQIVSRQGRAVSEAMSLIEDRKRRKDLMLPVREIHRLEHEADDVLTGALARVYNDVTDIPSVIRSIRWSELYGLLEDATDRAADVADVLEAIALSY